MKSIAITLLTSLISINGFASSKVITTCTNEDGTTSLRLTQVDQTGFKAAIKVESVGGSYPTFQFKNIKMVSGFFMNTPAIYQGAGFTLTQQGQDGLLEVPSIGINSEQLTCK